MAVPGWPRVFGGYGQALGRELERKAALFDDDAAFLLEVHEGRSQAPGMDPHHELQTLQKRCSDFKKEFQARTSTCPRPSPPMAAP